MTQTATVPGGSDREYETIYVLRPDVDREGTERVSTRVSDVIGKSGGKLTRVENWGRRRLAYDVSKYKRGVYVYLKYIGRGKLVSELERNLRMLDSVLKFQTVKLRDGLTLESVSVSDDEVKFEHVEPSLDEEPEESLAQILGLEEPPRQEPAAESSEESDAEAKKATGGEQAPAEGEASASSGEGGESAGAGSAAAGEESQSKGDSTEEEKE